MINFTQPSENLKLSKLSICVVSADLNEIDLFNPYLYQKDSSEVVTNFSDQLNFFRPIKTDQHPQRLFSRRAKKNFPFPNSSSQFLISFFEECVSCTNMKPLGLTYFFRYSNIIYEPFPLLFLLSNF